MTLDEPILVDIDAIDGNLRPASQMRVELNRDALERYAEDLDELPPVELMFDAESNTYWVIDGAHTITATRLVGQDEILAVIHEGTFLDAYRLASRANAKRGVPLSQGDKTHRVVEALKMPALADTTKWTQEKVADLCGVDQSLVSRLDHRELYDTHINPQPGNLGKPGRPAGYRKPKEESKTESDGKAESNGQTVTASSTPPATTATRREPTEAEINEKAAEQWENHIQNALNIISSLERRGGVKTLMEKWSKAHRKQFASQFEALVEEYQMIISQIKETL